MPASPAASDGVGGLPGKEAVKLERAKVPRKKRGSGLRKQEAENLEPAPNAEEASAGQGLLGDAESSLCRAREVELHQVAAAAQVTPVLEALQKAHPRRRRIAPATAGFVEALLGLGLSKGDMCTAFARNPGLFARTREGLLERWEVLSRHGVAPADFGTMLLGNTWWLSKPADEVEASIVFLEGLVGEGAVVRLLSSAPGLLTFSAADLKENLRRLRAEGVTDAARIVRWYPGVLCCSADEVARKIANLKVVFGDDGAAMAALQKLPRLLHVSPDTVRETHAWLECTFGREVARRMVARDSRLLTSRHETAAGTFAELVRVFGKERARSVAVVRPLLLQQSWECLFPKVQYLAGALAGGLDEVAEHPSILGYSLEGRIKLRLEALKAAGKDYTSIVSVLTYTDRKFESVFGVALPPPARGGDGLRGRAPAQLQPLCGAREEEPRRAL